MREYLQMLIWTMFFVVIVEMTFPNSSIKKYLKFVLGFIVMYVIISPIADLIIESKYIPGDSLENYIQYYQEYLGDEITYSEIEDEKNKQQEGLMKLYLSQIEEQAKSILEAELEVIEVKNISLEGKINEADFTISSVEIDVLVKEQEGIQIGVGDKSESTVLSEVQLKKEIEKYLNDFYNLDNTNIHITVQKN